MRMPARTIAGRASQDGLALLLSLAYLFVIAIIGGVIIEAASLQFRMAGNHASRAVVEQDARAIAHELTAAVDAALQLPPGYRICGAGDAPLACDGRGLARPSLLGELGRDGAAYSLRRRYPATVHAAVGRERQWRASSAAHDRFALYEVSVSLNAQPGRPGSASIVRGVAVRLPSEPVQ